MSRQTSSWVSSKRWLEACRLLRRARSTCRPIQGRPLPLPLLRQHLSACARVLDCPGMSSSRALWRLSSSLVHIITCLRVAAKPMGQCQATECLMAASCCAVGRDWPHRTSFKHRCGQGHVESLILTQGATTRMQVAAQGRSRSMGALRQLAE